MFKEHHGRYHKIGIAESAESHEQVNTSIALKWYDSSHHLPHVLPRLVTVPIAVRFIRSGIIFLDNSILLLPLENNQLWGPFLCLLCCSRIRWNSAHFCNTTYGTNSVTYLLHMNIKPLDGTETR